jgi:hypothetical protein
MIESVFIRVGLPQGHTVPLGIRKPKFVLLKFDRTPINVLWSAGQIQIRPCKLNLYGLVSLMDFWIIYILLLSGLWSSGLLTPSTPFTFGRVAEANGLEICL